MRRALITTCLVAACTSQPEPPDNAINAVSFVEDHVLPERPRPSFDLLIVIDDTVAMAGHRARLASLPVLLDETVTRGALRYSDVHVAVISNSGVLRRVATVPDAFASLYLDYDLSIVSNYGGTLASVLAPLLDVGATNHVVSQPFTAIQLALEHDSGFLRANAYLGIVIISDSDDASAQPVAEFAQYLKSLKPDPANVVVVGLTGDTTPRLDELFAAFPHRATTVSLRADDYAPAFDVLGLLIKSTLEGYCWRAADIDPVTPGAQLDCTFSVTYHGTEHVLPPCTEAGQLFCWSMMPNDQCSEPAFEPRTPPYGLRVFQPALRAQCVSN